nr:putative reverse transcriptase domain-containing protein [Tanacetum cinerariifolium]
KRIRDRDDLDGKGESEGEVVGIENSNFISVDGTYSGHILLSAEPLAKRAGSPLHDGPRYHDFSMMDILPGKSTSADANMHVPLDEIKVNKTLCFVEEPVEILDREIKKLKHRKIALVKVRWNSRGPEFTWEHEGQMMIKYPRLFVDRVVEPSS